MDETKANLKKSSYRNFIEEAKKALYKACQTDKKYCPQRETNYRKITSPLVNSISLFAVRDNYGLTTFQDFKEFDDVCGALNAYLSAFNNTPWLREEDLAVPGNAAIGNDHNSAMSYVNSLGSRMREREHINLNTCTKTYNNGH